MNRKEYKIAVAAGKKVELTIVDFEIEADGSTCPYDNLKAYDTPAGGSATLIAVRIFNLFSLFTYRFYVLMASVQGICGSMAKYEMLGPWTGGAWVSSINLVCD